MKKEKEKKKKKILGVEPPNAYLAGEKEEFPNAPDNPVVIKHAGHY